MRSQSDSWLSRQIVAHGTEIPDHPAIVAGREILSYAALSAESAAVAAAIHCLGVGEGSVCACSLERSVHMPAVWLGVWRAGCAYLPLDLSWPEFRRDTILTASAAEVLIQLDAGQIVCSRTDDGRRTEVTAGADTGNSVIQASSADDLAYVIYTSGTTGEPKGVEVEFASLENLVTWMKKRFELKPLDRCGQFASSAFDAAVIEVWPPLAAGAALVMIDENEKQDPDSVWGWVVRERLSLAYLPTPAVEALMTRPAPPGVCLRSLYTGGAALRRRPPSAWTFEFLNCYGPTEATVCTTGDVVAPEGERIPSIGRPIDGVQVHVLDEHRNPVSPGVEGELYIGGRSVARGYRLDPDLTRARFVTGPGGPDDRLYRTGDLVCELDDGAYEFRGRVDRQLKIAGYRIEPAEVERELMQLAGVKGALVFSKPLGEKLLAVVEGENLDGEAIRRALTDRVPRWMIPHRVYTTSSLPLTSSGKIDEKATVASLGELAFEGPAAEGDSILDRLLAEVMRELGDPAVDPRAGFFDIGGNSLSAVQIASKLQESLGRPIPIAVFFEEDSLQAIAERLEASFASVTD